MHVTGVSAPAGEVRYWIGAGRGGFALSSKECVRSSLYIVVYSTSGKALDASRGWAVTTSPVPPKDDMFATIKSNNYLPNALNAMDAEAQGYDEVPSLPLFTQAVWLNAFCCPRDNAKLKGADVLLWSSTILQFRKGVEVLT